ncbi:MAG TPA: TetR family transcriptional regulator C-terminal domain-containing protein [Stackebrandtia sp.]|jgi:AcrR family transcriptional regulator|uniref:TetR/AcrR family transcriptional regulator n=1 Tax=Stackebrandtia sp. TaxID=2023065 RepID=UPI002D75079C|nr:TetR family transcriptional regulator C-terminal domain-containing protein [Stackebrandtia sp.]HZE39395.1 TetR family transcriptional regulator C-terminal domain-containing protein [Stackebrandtia sp.]
MPKIVDPTVRRTEVIEAVFRIAERDGLEHASLRNIAAEAGLAVGSVRHYFADHAEVMTFAMRELVERMSQRILRHADTIGDRDAAADRFEATLDLLAEFLPLDDARRTEEAAWLSFVNAARTDARLRPYAKRMHEGFRMVTTRVIAGGQETGRIAATVDVDLESERLAAVLDGLTLSAITQPDAWDNATALAVVRRHMEDLLSH